MAQYIGFTLGGEEYSIPILKVREIINLPAMTRLPRAPEYIEGVTNLRGHVVPIVNIKKIVRVGEGTDGGGKVIILANGRVTFGILVDGITGVIGIDESAIEPADRILEGSSDRLLGLAKCQERLVALLDTAKILPADSLEMFEENALEVQEGGVGKAEAVTAVHAAEGEDRSRELRDAREFLNRKIEGNDPNHRILATILDFMEAATVKDYRGAETALERISELSSEGLYREVGKVTRRLHDSLKSFREAIEPKISSFAANDMPDAIDRLQFVMDKTEEAANKTMGIVEKHLLRMDELAGSIRRLREPEDAVKYLKEFKNTLEDDLTEIITTQSFQDITGQTIKKVIRLVSEIEKELAGMVAAFGVKVDPGSKAKGPPRETVSQAGVDDLLKEFGF